VAELTGMDVFVYLPHVFFVAEFGVDHFEASMRAQYELTQRFTAEYSIRVFIERYPQQTLARLQGWNVHVRRLVSEGTRPRLPWAPRLRAFQVDPRPVLELLELLKDDSELLVRRSVANNLNDIGKDNPAALIDTCRRWARDATAERGGLVRHALRSAVKQGEPEALQILGFVPATGVRAREIQITPAVASIGQSVTFTVELVNEGTVSKQLLVNLRVHFMKASGRPSPKVFTVKELELGPGRVRAVPEDDLPRPTHNPHPLSRAPSCGGSGEWPGERGWRIRCRRRKPRLASLIICIVGRRAGRGSCVTATGPEQSACREWLAGGMRATRASRTFGVTWPTMAMRLQT
jgi:3-methyladenine DNA glycosylase AlkC